VVQKSLYALLSEVVLGATITVLRRSLG